MTKEKIARLISLVVQREREDGLRETEAAVAYNDLLMEFQAWDPEAIRRERDAALNGERFWLGQATKYNSERYAALQELDAAWQVARDILKEYAEFETTSWLAAGVEEWERKYPRLKGPP